MKKLIMVFVGTIAFYGCYGQRYEVWVNPTGHKYETKGYYGFSNDSVLTIYSKTTYFIPSTDYNIRWDKISALNIRSRTKNEMGVIIGTAIGTLVTYLLFESEKKGNIDLGSEYGGGILISLGVIGGGSLIGHLMTCAKINIPFNGKSAKEKNQVLRDRIKRKS
jgi:hypothetical protein